MTAIIPKSRAILVREKKQSQKIQKQTRDPKERNGCKGKPSPERQNDIVRTNAGKTRLKG